LLGVSSPGVLSTSREPGGSRAPVDRRLITRVRVARRFVVVSVAIGVAATACVVGQAVFLATIIERVLIHGKTVDQVTPQLIGLGITFGLRGVLVWVGEVAAQRTSADVTFHLRQQVLQHALDLGPTWLASERAGELSLTATRGVAALDTYFGRYLPQAVLAALAPAGILVWVGYTDWISLLVLLALVCTIPVAMIKFGRRASQEAARQWRTLSSLSARMLELVQGLPTLRAFGRADQGRREVAEATESLRRTTMRTLRVSFLSSLALELIAGLGTGLVAMVLGLRLLNGSVSLYPALAVLLVSPEVFLPLRRAGAEFHAATEGQAAARRIFDILDEEPISRERSSGGTDEGAGDKGLTTPDPSKGSIEIADIVVSFPDRKEPVLEHFDLTVAAGEHVALVGASGTGKSSLLGVLLGFVPLEHGRVLVEGIDLVEVEMRQWRERLAWVPQRPRMFRGTLADNLRLGKPDATRMEVERACQIAGLDPLVSRLPEGFEAAVGEAGSTLSAGERQRVAIARAFLRDAPLVLLDEPGAHLDPAAQESLSLSLFDWLDSRTVIVAAHRPEIIGRVDRIVDLGLSALSEVVNHK